MFFSKIAFSSLLLTMLLNESFGMTPGQQRAMEIVMGYKTRNKAPDGNLRKAIASIAKIRSTELVNENLQSYVDSFNLGDKPEEIAKKITEKVRVDLGSSDEARKKLEEERKRKEQDELKHKQEEQRKLAEAKKKEEELRKQRELEEQKKLEEERKRKEQDELKRKQEEQRKLEEAKKKEEELRKQRELEERKKLEEERKKKEAADEPVDEMLSQFENFGAYTEDPSNEYYRLDAVYKCDDMLGQVNREFEDVQEKHKENPADQAKFEELTKKVENYRKFVAEKKVYLEANELVDKLLKELEKGIYCDGDISRLSGVKECNSRLEILDFQFVEVIEHNKEVPADEAKIKEVTEKVELAKKSITKRIAELLIHELPDGIDAFIKSNLYSSYQIMFFSHSECKTKLQVLIEKIDNVNKDLQIIEEAFKDDGSKKLTIVDIKTKVDNFIKAVNECKQSLEQRIRVWEATAPVLAMLRKLDVRGEYSYTDGSDLKTIAECEEKRKKIEEEFNTVKDANVKNPADENEFKKLEKIVADAQEKINSKLEILRVKEPIDNMLSNLKDAGGKYELLAIYSLYTAEELDEMSRQIAQEIANLKDNAEKYKAELEEKNPGVDLDSTIWKSIGGQLNSLEDAAKEMLTIISFRKDDLKELGRDGILKDKLSYYERYNADSIMSLKTEEECDALLKEVEAEFKLAQGDRHLNDEAFGQLEKKIDKFGKTIENQKKQIRENNLPEIDEDKLKKARKARNKKRRAELRINIGSRFVRHRQDEVKLFSESMTAVDYNKFLKEDTLKKVEADDFYVKDSDYSEENAINAVLAKTGDNIGFAEYSKLSNEKLDSLSKALLKHYNEKKHELTSEQISNLFGAVEFVRLYSRYKGMCPNVYFLEVDAQNDFSYLMLSTLLDEVSGADLDDEKVLEEIIGRMESVASGIFKSVFKQHVHGIPNDSVGNMYSYVRFGSGVVSKEKLIEAEAIGDLNNDSNAGIRDRIVDMCLNTMSLGMVTQPANIIKEAITDKFGSDYAGKLSEKQNAFMQMLDKYKKVVNRVEQKIADTYIDQKDAKYIRVLRPEEKYKDAFDLHEKYVSNYLEPYSTVVAAIWGYSFAKAAVDAEPLDILKSNLVDYSDKSSINSVYKKVAIFSHPDKYKYDEATHLFDFKYGDFDKKFLSYRKGKFDYKDDKVNGEMFSPYDRLKEVLYSVYKMQREDKGADDTRAQMNEAIKKSKIFAQENSYLSFIEQYLRHTTKK